MDYVRVGKLISKKRKQKKITKKQLAEILDVEKECITYWEKGKCLPFLDRMIKLSSVLEIPLNDLMGNDADLIDNTLSKRCYLMMLYSMLVALSYYTPLFMLFLVSFLIIGSMLLFKELKKLYN